MTLFSRREGAAGRERAERLRRGVMGGEGAGRNGRNVQRAQEMGSLGRNLGIRLQGLKALCSWLPSCHCVKSLPPLDWVKDGWLGAWPSRSLPSAACLLLLGLFLKTSALYPLVLACDSRSLPLHLFLLGRSERGTQEPKTGECLTVSSLQVRSQGTDYISWATFLRRESNAKAKGMNCEKSISPNNYQEIES